MSILATKKISKHFDGVRAVHNVSLEFEKGSITGLVGPNGSGKSTFINLVTGVIPKDSGTLTLSDKVPIEVIRRHDMFEFKIARTFQAVHLFEQISVLDNILLALTKRGLWAAIFENNTKLYEERAREILEKVGLSEKINAQAEELSYGQRKLLEIARVIAMDAEILFFDEPYAGLFPEMVKKVSAIIKELRIEGRTIILVEHNMDLIRELCDHLVVFDSGEILAQGKPTEVLARRDVVEAYLGE